MDPLIYQYIIGGLVFAIGLFFGFKQDYLSFSGKGLKSLLLCTGGLLFFFSLQSYLQYGDMTETPSAYQYQIEKQDGRNVIQIIENGTARPATVTDYPAPSLGIQKSPEEITKIQETSAGLLAGDKQEQQKLGTSLDYAIMIG